MMADPTPRKVAKRLSRKYLGYSSDFRALYYEDVIEDRDGKPVTRYTTVRLEKKWTTEYYNTSRPEIDIPVEYIEPSGL